MGKSRFGGKIAMLLVVTVATAICVAAVMWLRHPGDG